MPPTGYVDIVGLKVNRDSRLGVPQAEMHSRKAQRLAQAKDAVSQN